MTTHPTGAANPKRMRSLAAFRSALPGTHGQIARQSGMSKKTVTKLIAELHGKGLRISGWLPHPLRGPALAVYAEGDDPDALDTLPRLTKKQIYLRYEARIRGTATADRRLAKCRAVYWRKKAAGTPNSWFGALPGARVASMNAEG